MREASSQDKAIEFPHLFYIRFCLGIEKHKILFMERELEDYVVPQIEVIEVEVEKGFAASTDLDPDDWS